MLLKAVCILDSYHVVVAGLRVDPVAGGDHAIGGHGGNHVLHHVLGGESDQAGLFTVDIQGNSRIVQILGDVNAAHIRHRFDLLGEGLGQCVGAMHIHRTDLNINRSWQSLIDHAIHQTTAWK
jgi:hypothetical protein